MLNFWKLLYQKKYQKFGYKLIPWDPNQNFRSTICSLGIHAQRLLNPESLKPRFLVFLAVNQVMVKQISAEQISDKYLAMQDWWYSPIVLPCSATKWKTSHLHTVAY